MKVPMRLLLVFVLLGFFQTAQSAPYPDTYEDQPLVVVQFPAKLGARIGGGIGQVVSVPMGIMAAPLGYLAFKDAKAGFKFPIAIGDAIGTYVGYHIGGFPGWLPKFIFWDIPFGPVDQ